MTSCDFANYKPASRVADPCISEETLNLKTCYMLAATAVTILQAADWS